jgi:hypothetical protein
MAVAVLQSSDRMRIEIIGLGNARISPRDGLFPSPSIASLYFSKHNHRDVWRDDRCQKASSTRTSSAYNELFTIGKQSSGILLTSLPDTQSWVILVSLRPRAVTNLLTTPVLMLRLHAATSNVVGDGRSHILDLNSAENHPFPICKNIFDCC